MKGIGGGRKEGGREGEREGENEGIPGASARS